MKCRDNIWLYFSLLCIKMINTFPNYAKLSLTACLKILCSDPRNRYPKLKSPSAQHWHDRLLPLHQAKCMWRRSENQEDTKEGARTPSEAAAVSSRTSWWRPPICSWIRASFSIRQIEYRVFPSIETCWFCLRVIWSISVAKRDQEQWLILYRPKYRKKGLHFRPTHSTWQTKNSTLREPVCG